MGDLRRMKQKLGQDVFYSEYWKGLAKHCSRCQVNRSLDNFFRDRRATTGYCSVCKMCRRIESRKLYPEKRDKIRVRAARHYAKHREAYRVKYQKRYQHIKNRKYELEERLGMGLKQHLGRDRLARAVIMNQSLRGTYKLRISTKEVREFLKGSRPYNRIFNKWVVSEYDPQLAPIFFSKNRQPESINDMHITTWIRGYKWTSKNIRLKRKQRLSQERATSDTMRLYANPSV